MLEVYEFYFFEPSVNRFGRLCIAADSEWQALTRFNEIDDLIFKGQKLIKFIEGGCYDEKG
jgi:hypothetical protein